jgi:hypothetical protein
MPTIPYDPTPRALFLPGDAPTVFEAERNPSEVQIAVEAARLAYVRAEQSGDDEQRLASALGLAGFEAVQLFADRVTDSQAFGAFRRSDAMALVAFRGTEPQAIQDIVGDADVKLVHWQAGGAVRGLC